MNAICGFSPRRPEGPHRALMSRSGRRCRRSASMRMAVTLAEEFLRRPHCGVEGNPSGPTSTPHRPVLPGCGGAMRKRAVFCWTCQPDGLARDFALWRKGFLIPLWASSITVPAHHARPAARCPGWQQAVAGEHADRRLERPLARGRRRGWPPRAVGARSTSTVWCEARVAHASSVSRGGGHQQHRFASVPGSDLRCCRNGRQADRLAQAHVHAAQAAPTGRSRCRKPASPALRFLIRAQLGRNEAFRCRQGMREPSVWWVCSSTPAAWPGRESGCTGKALQVFRLRCAAGAGVVGGEAWIEGAELFGVAEIAGRSSIPGPSCCCTQLGLRLLAAAPWSFEGQGDAAIIRSRRTFRVSRAEASVISPAAPLDRQAQSGWPGHAEAGGMHHAARHTAQAWRRPFATKHEGFAGAASICKGWR